MAVRASGRRRSLSGRGNQANDGAGSVPSDLAALCSIIADLPNFRVIRSGMRSADVTIHLPMQRVIRIGGLQMKSHYRNLCQAAAVLATAFSTAALADQSGSATLTENTRHPLERDDAGGARPRWTLQPGEVWFAHLQIHHRPIRGASAL
jgi:hypothetical protein